MLRSELGCKLALPASLRLCSSGTSGMLATSLLWKRRRTLGRGAVARGCEAVALRCEACGCTAADRLSVGSAADRIVVESSVSTAER
jgi:hypothetical protein